MTPTESWVTAVVMLALGVFFLLCALYPKCRDWIHPTRPSKEGAAPWYCYATFGICWLSFGIALLGDAADIGFIKKHIGYMLGFSLAALFGSVLVGLILRDSPPPQ